jgi:uncharacterized protein (TIGR02145 family)
MPVLSTLSVKHITNTSAWSGGKIVSYGGSFILERGICWNNLPCPTISDNKITEPSEEIIFSSFITGLCANTTYYMRAFATNWSGTGYGNEESFTTANYKTVTDFENNTYNIVEIGNQVWIRENLRSSRFNDGTYIQNETKISSWLKLTSPGYCWYYNDSVKYKTEYGALYNWYAVNTGKLCPAGWHVPDNAEWTILFNNLGGLNNAGGKLKETDTLHWVTPNNGATNESDFNALPGGRTMNYFEVYNPGYLVDFIGIGSEAYWWSSDEYSESHGMYFKIKNTSAGVESGNTFKTLGFSVRCLKDQK